MPGYLSDRMPESEHISYTPNRRPENMSDRMPGDMSVYVSDRMPEDIYQYMCQIECQNVCREECQKICKTGCQNIERQNR